jgi:MscS family membrane protein
MEAAVTRLESLMYKIMGEVSWIELAVALAFLLLFLRFRTLLSTLLFRMLGLVTSRSKNRVDTRLFKESREAVNYLIGVTGLAVALSILSLAPEKAVVVRHITATLYYIGFSWIMFVLVDLFAREIGKKLTGGRKKVRSEMVNFIIKFLKTVIVLAALIVIFREWEYDVSAIITSLGLGGLAFALAAKDTIANLFGSMVILWDRPFEHGDWIQTAHVEGTVVEIGLRSTTVRTFANALTTVPNASLANETITNWTKRQAGRQIKFEIGVTYGSRREDIKAAVAAIREMLTAHEGIAKDLAVADNDALVSKNDLLGNKDTLIVQLDNFGSSSINILVYCFSVTVNWLEWLAVKEDVMYKIMEILDANNLTFAFPSQSIYIEKNNQIN